MSRLETYEVDQPWVIYRYLTTDRRTRFTGVAKIQCECAVCGESRVLKLRIPRFGRIVDRGKHPERIKFLLEHVHRGEKHHPMAWAKPLLNPAAHPGGIDLDLLAMRLQADLQADQEKES
jgi:hypothetical protein